MLLDTQGDQLTGFIQNVPENPGIGFYLVLLVLSLVLSLLGTPLARSLALKIGVVDAPSARKVHASPVPLLGGLAIYVAFTAALVFLSSWFLPFYISQIAAILLGATACGFVGLLDDKYGLSPLAKLLAQIGLAGWLVISGVEIDVFAFDPLNWALTLFWVVTIVNAQNFLDNMDGLSGGIAAIAAGFFFLIAYQSGQWYVAALGAALCGAAAGFVYHNFGIVAREQPRQIFMGDSGALFMGYLLAAIGIKLRFPNTNFVTWMVPVLVLGLPLFDITLVTISRLRRRLPVMRGGKDHTSHRLVLLGLTRREAVLMIYICCGSLGVAAMMVMGANVRDGYFVGGTVAVLAGWALLRLEHVPLINTNPKVDGYHKGLTNKLSLNQQQENQKEK